MRPDVAVIFSDSVHRVDPRLPIIGLEEVAVADPFERFYVSED